MTIFNSFTLRNNLTRASRGARKKIKIQTEKICSKENIKKRFPISRWLPHYDFPTFLLDLLAGATVGATAVAQGIAYAVIADISPEHGLYSSIIGGLLYTIFGNCKNMSIGPTAILSALITKYVHGLSPDFAVLAAFLSGVVQLALAVFQLGFLVEFLSGPVITGFVTAAAIQILTSQLKTLFGTKGSSGRYCLDSMYNLVLNIKTINWCDTVLGFGTIVTLILLKISARGCSRDDRPLKRIRWYLALGRNVVVVMAGMLIAFICHIIWENNSSLTLVGHIHNGLPKVEPPPFSTTVGNRTLSFLEMLDTFGPQFIVLPLIGILEVVVIAKAFTKEGQFDATQEIIALSLCNIFGSFLGSMPVTGSFSRSALYQASGVQTPAAGIIVSLIIMLSLSLLTSTFYFIPRSALAGLLIVAVTTLVHIDEIVYYWRNNKREFVVLVLTMMTSLIVGLEYGVILGVLVEVLIIMHRSARPKVNDTIVTIGAKDVMLIPMPERASYCSGSYLRKKIVKNIQASNIGTVVIIDGSNTSGIDSTVASNLMSIFDDVDERLYKIVFLNFTEKLKGLCLEYNDRHDDKFITGSCVEKLLEEGIAE